MKCLRRCEFKNEAVILFCIISLWIPQHLRSCYRSNDAYRSNEQLNHAMRHMTCRWKTFDKKLETKLLCQHTFESDVYFALKTDSRRALHVYSFSCSRTMVLHLTFVYSSFNRRFFYHIIPLRTTKICPSSHPVGMSLISHRPMWQGCPTLRGREGTSKAAPFFWKLDSHRFIMAVVTAPGVDISWVNVQPRARRLAVIWRPLTDGLFLPRSQTPAQSPVRGFAFCRSDSCRRWCPTAQDGATDSKRIA